MSRSLEILIGLIVVIFVLLITFKLLGIWATFQYEQQAQITAKNLQTAMNKVCVSGVPMEVKVNFPQKLKGGGISPDPISATLKKLSGREDVSVSNALLYTTALKSYGDPWYVIYYEEFPKGEDSGWEGWNQIAGMRISSIFAHGVDTAMCLAMAPLSFAGTFIRAGKMAARGMAKEAEEEVLRRVVRNIGDEEMEATIRLSKKLSKEVGEEAGEDIFMSSGRKAVRKFGKEVKGTLGKVWKWMEKQEVNRLLLHKRVAREVLEESEEGAKYFSKVPSHYGVGRETSKEILNDIDKLFNGKITNTEFKQTVERLANADYSNIYREYGRHIGEDLSKSQLSKLSPEEREILIGVANKLERGEKITGNEFKAVRNCLLDRDFKPKFSEADKIYEKFENVRGISRFQSEMESIKSNKLKDVFDDATPFSYTRTILKMGEAEGSNPGLFKIAEAYRKLGGFKSSRNIAGKKIMTKEGTWIGSTFVFSQTLPLLEGSNLKFYPCSDHALCLKSQVNPSITVYPLEDCKEAGVDWVQLEKYPYEGSISVKSTTYFDMLANFIVGGKSNSRFYVASPCGGKIKIWKDKCGCNYQSVPYFDTSTQDLFFINCTILNADKDLKCDVYKIPGGEENEEREHVNSFEVNHKKISFKTDSINTVKVYTLSFSLVPYYPFNMYKDFNLICNDTIIKVSPGASINCDPLKLFAYVFNYSTCSGYSDLWLECVNWSGEGDAILEKNTIDGKKIKVDATKWCCLQWNMSYYPEGITGERKYSVKIVNVSNCEEYTGFLSGPKKAIEILKNVNTAVHRYEGVIPDDNFDPDKYFNQLVLPKKESLVEMIKNSGKDLISFFGYYPKESEYSPIVYTIINQSEITLPKKTDSGEDIDLTDEDTNKLFMFNLPAYGEVDCLKVSFSADKTKGFCYTSPTGIHDVEAGGWYAASIIADIGVQVALDILTEGGGAVTGVSSFASCMAGNAVLWFGENMVSEAREKNYWPHSAYFSNYYTK